MITIISATNRKNSKSIQIAQLYQAILENSGTECQLISLTELPTNLTTEGMYEKVGKHAEFNTIIKRMTGSEKFLFVVPEYNGSFPGILKIFIDSMSYPSPFARKKGALVGIGSGAMGGALALSHLTDILNYLGMHVMANKLRLPKIESILIEGKINDTFLSGLIENQIKDLISF